MKKIVLTLGAALTMLLAGCGEGSDQPKIEISKTPASIRGWIRDAVPADPNIQVLDPTMAAMRRIEMFRQSAISVEGAKWASGGLAEQGSFIMLDVPPGDVTLLFQMHNVGDVRLELKGVPGNADVFLPGMVLSPKGVTFIDPSKIAVRLPGEKRQPTNQWVTIANQRVQAIEVPLVELTDRRDYPLPPDQQAAPKVLGVEVK